LQLLLYFGFKPATGGIGNESMPKIIINDTINLFFKLQSAFCQFQTVSFRVLFDKISSVYLKKYIFILVLEMASSGNQHCANCIGTLSFPIFHWQKIAVCWWGMRSPSMVFK